MRYLIILLALLPSLCYGQFKKSNNGSIPVQSISKDSVVVRVPTPFQLETITITKKKIQELQTQFDRDLTLILGISWEEIANLEFKEGKFIVTLKRKE